MNENITPSTIKFSQSRLGKKPNRAHDTDAGIDFFVPTFTSAFIKDLIEKNPYLLERDGYSGLSTSSTSGNNYYVTSNGNVGIGSPCPTSQLIVSGCTGTSGLSCSQGVRLDIIEKPIPENLNIVKFDAKLGLSYFELHAHERVLIPSGIYCAMASKDRALIAANKSGVATKTGLVFGAQVVDSDYQGEIHISLINTSNVGVRIYEDMKAIQFIETPIYLSTIEFVDTSDDLYNTIKSARGATGFGASDKKMLSE